MAQVSNVQSRTLKVLGNLPETVKDSLSKLPEITLLEKESKFEGKSKTFITADNISEVIDLLSKNNITFRPHFYSLFAKFSNELKSEDINKLNDKVKEIAPKVVVSYSRIDSNGHTGKVVIDRFDDYNLLRTFEGDYTFYKFNRSKAQTRTSNDVQENNNSNDKKESNDGFVPVRQRVFKPRQTEGEKSEYKPRRPFNNGEKTEYKPRRTFNNGEKTEYKPRQPFNNGEPRSAEDSTQRPNARTSRDTKPTYASKVV